MKKHQTTIILSLVLAVCLVILGFIIFEFIPKDCTHHTCDKTLHEPTCDKKGYQTYVCTDCGYTFDADFVAPLGHSFTEKTVEPTCDTEGYTAHTCSTCGIVDKDDFVRPTGHTYKETVYAPKCEEQGYTYYECINCDFSMKSDYVEPTGHTVTDRVVKPTCNDEGFTLHTCKSCDYSYTNNFTKPTGHIYSKTVIRPNIDKTGYTKYTCSECGSTHVSDYVFYSDIFSGAEGEGRGELAWGVDLSKWSKTVDFEALKAAGVDFVILRVGSNVNKDPYFDTYYAAAKAAGLDVGAYFFTYAESKTEAYSDAQRVANWLEGKQLEYPVFYDIEDDKNYDYYPSQFEESLITTIAHTFMTEMVNRGYYPGLYTNNKFLYNTFNSEKTLRLYDVWYAHWTTVNDGIMSEYSSTYSMWQYMGDVEGFANGAVEGMCDVNYSFKNYPEIMKKHGFNGY